ncbi:MAG TPA: type II toxin-antitoxin system PemK/MazF family toxin [Vicinamibacteria bacterium]|nr:type II toxin-antitoxin system PemK/MazF family toxin [Vicinamibacteria bacterium]
MKTGDLYLVNLDPAVGDEIRKTRPVVVLNPGHEKHLRLAIVVPVTAWKDRWETNPFFLTLDPETRHGLKKRSAVDCFQLRALSHGRFVQKLGSLNGNEIDRVKSSVALILGIEPEHCWLQI